MKKIQLLFLLALLISATINVFAANPPHTKIAIVNLVDTSATHVFGNLFDATYTPSNIIDYGNYSIEALTQIMSNENMELTEIEAPYDFNDITYVSFVGTPSNKVKLWLAMLQSNHEFDYVIVMVRKFVPNEKINSKYLEGQQYGFATYLETPDFFSVFSFVGYYIFSVDKMKLVRMNSNHDKYVVLDIPFERDLNSDELANPPEKYQEMAKAKLLEIIDTRNLEIKRSIVDYTLNSK
jgi:hypothetical protein